ncbi:MAG: acetate uptake transporter [Acidimicrobiales bacterium]
MDQEREISDHRPVATAAPPSVIADPRALGYAAFATTTFVFGLALTTIWSSAAVSALSLILVYGGAIQILAGIWAFARRLTFASTVFCSFGAFYVAYYLLVHTVHPGLSASAATTAMAVFLLSWLILSSFVLVAATRVNGAAATVYFFWWLTFLLLVIGEFIGSPNLLIAGGAAGIASAAAAWYASGAFLLNETSGSTIVPLFEYRARSEVGGEVRGPHIGGLVHRGLRKTA